MSSPARAGVLLDTKYSMREQRSLGRQAVQCRSDHPSPARTPHGIPALLVGHDQNHMRLHPGSSRHSGSPSGHTQRQNRQHLISLHATHPPFRHGSSSAASAAQRAFPAAGVQDSPARMPPSCDKVADGCHCPSQSSAPQVIIFGPSFGSMYFHSPARTDST